MVQHKKILTPEDGARITELQDLLIERFVEHIEATTDGLEERVRTLETEIDGLLREKKEIEK
jgi:hypothetical protein